LTLLEVILALAILAGAMAVLGEASRLAMRNAEAAHDLAQAQLLCETVMSEIVAGIVPAQAVQNSRFDTSELQDPDAAAAWLYTITTDQTGQTGLIVVQVTVGRDLPAEQHPIQFSLVRWLPDPNATSTSSSSQQSSSSGTSSSSGGGNAGS
jgi:type II secretory pathway pseudopilin PulG